MLKKNEYIIILEFNNNVVDFVVIEFGYWYFIIIVWSIFILIICYVLLEGCELVLLGNLFKMRVVEVY